MDERDICEWPIDGPDDRERRRRMAEELQGSWSDEEAMEARRRIRELRASWRTPRIWGNPE